MRRLVSVIVAAGFAATTALVAAPSANALTVGDIASPTTGRTSVTTLPGIAPAIIRPVFSPTPCRPAASTACASHRWP